MKTSLLLYRRILLVCAVLFVVVAIVVALGVIKSVQADTFPGATPERAVPAFRVIMGLNLLDAVIIVFIFIWLRGRSWISTSILIILGLVALLFGIALIDAAFAYKSEGPSMQIVSILIFFCAAADFLAGALVITTTFLCPKKT